MKKRLSLLLSVMMIFALVTGCAIKGNSNAYVKPSATSAPQSQAADTSISEYNVDDYVVLGQYKGVKVQAPSTEVTDDELQQEIQDTLQQHATEKTITDRGAQKDDTVNVNCTGTVNGVANDNLTCEDMDVVIGAGNFIPGFEDGLVSAKTGDTVTVNATFPTDYSETSLQGQTAVFTVKINSITESALPEYNDAFVAGISDFKTTAEYEADVKKGLQEQKAEDARSQTKNDVWTAIVANAKLNSVPDAEMQKYLDEAYAYFKEDAANSGVDYSEYVTQNFETEEKLDAYIRECATTDLKDILVSKAIAKAENITISDDEYKAGIQSYIENAGYSSDDEFKQAKGKTFEEYYGKTTIYDTLLSNKVVDFVTDAADLT